MYFGGYGLYRALDCRNWWGWLLTGLALLLAIVATLSGGFRALPWDWTERWHDEQQTEYPQLFMHDNQKPLTTHIVSRELHRHVVEL